MQRRNPPTPEEIRRIKFLHEVQDLHPGIIAKRLGTSPSRIRRILEGARNAKA